MRRQLVLRMIAFLVVALGVVVGLHAYIAKRLLFDSAPPLGLQLVGLAVMALGFLCILGGVLAWRVGPPRLGTLISRMGYLWMGAFALLLVTVAGTDVLRVLLGAALSTEVGISPERLQAWVVVGLTVPGLWVGYRTAMGTPRVVRVEVPIASLPEGLDGLRIVQLSDVHIGPTLKGDFLERVVAQANALGPDLVAITGDLVDGSVLQLREHVRALSALEAPLGSYFVTGNHEYYSGAPQWEMEVARLGVRVLHNEHVVLERGGGRLVLAGVTDHDGGQFGEKHACRPDLAFAGAPEGVPRLLLAHQPRSAKLAAPFGVDLQLSGHTHGGQFFPWMFFVRLQQPTVGGLSTVAGVRVYTSRGTGYWGPPLRIGTAPEITELVLRRG